MGLTSTLPSKLLRRAPRTPARGHSQLSSAYLHSLCSVMFHIANYFQTNRSSRRDGRELLGGFPLGRRAKWFGPAHYSSFAALVIAVATAIARRRQESTERERNDTRLERKKNDRRMSSAWGPPPLRFLKQVFVKHFITSESESRFTAF